MESKTDIISEKESLAVAITPGNFTEMKQVLEYIFNMLGIRITINEPSNPPAHFIDGRAINIKIGDTTIGTLGEIHPKILKNWKIKMPVSLMEINLEQVLNR